MKRLEKGFTLIELMIVVAIIAILAAVAAPKFGQQLKKAKDAKGIELVGTWRSALTMLYSDTTYYPANMGELEKYVDTKTKAKTLGTNGGAYANTAKTASVEVGTGKVVNNKNYANFEISTTGDAIDFTSSEVDSKGTTWSAY